MDIHLGSWVCPLIATFFIFGFGIWKADREPQGGDYAFGKAAVSIFWFFIAVIVSLIAWLIWALLT